MADLTTPHEGRKFNLYRESDSVPGTYEFFCLADNFNYKLANSYNDTTRSDCSTPTNVPNTTRNVNTRTWTVSFTGKITLAGRRLLRADALLAAGKSYRVKWDETGANGGGTETFMLKFDDLQFGKESPNGNTTFTVNGTVEGTTTWADAA